MNFSKDDLLTAGLIVASLVTFPFFDDRTKLFLELLMIGGQFGIQVSCDWLLLTKTNRYIVSLLNLLFSKLV